MKYTIILTETPKFFQAIVPNLPDCRVKAKTRQAALDKIRDSVMELMQKSEILMLDIPVLFEAGSLREETPWDMFGLFKDDPTWGQLFDTIERERIAA